MPDLDLTTLSAEDEGDGVRVKLSFFARGFSLLDAISAVQDRINNATGGTTSHVEPVEADETSAADAGPAQHDGGDVGTRRARRSRRSGGEAKPVDAGDDGVPALGSADPNVDKAPAPAPAPAPRRRRRATGAATDASAGEDSAGDTEAKPARRRAKRAPKEDVSGDGDGGAHAGDRGGAGAREPDDAPRLTLADLGKAASAAAEKITPAGVIAVLAEFKVKKVNDLAKEDWQEFVDILVDRMQQADAEASS